MFIMNERQIRDEKMKQLKKGQSAYAESYVLIRLLLRDIKKYNLQVHCDRTNIGCWFIPISDQE